ncbi:bacillithiol biosynthesis cysteine-adding enzyme BshC [Cerasibacillus sp. JNUCC 74]
MRIKPIDLYQQTKLLRDYRDYKQKIHTFFDYKPLDDFDHRYHDLQQRNFKREELSNALLTMNRQWDAPESTYRNIQRLRTPEAVTVIGGQQAGVLTGPMYTINKIISIIKLAKEQEEKLNVPVIPVFWIAGEDHDFAEINHIFIEQEQQMYKYQVHQQVNNKTAISDIQIDKQIMNPWLDDLFKQLTETNYTKQLYDEIRICLETSKTYVDFFAKLIFRLFPRSGLVLIDSGNKHTRELESDYFVQLIKHQPQISKGVSDAITKLQKLGYSPLLTGELTDAHLFYYQEGERILLNRMENGDWEGKQHEIRLTTAEMIQIAETNPFCLSNNVVTRPIMQELLFPNLAFIAGPGELSYWSALKAAFHALRIKMPPILPRYSITIVERSVEKLLKHYQLDTERVINNGVLQDKAAWLERKNTPSIQQTADEVRKKIARAQLPLREVATAMRSDLGALAEKNLFYLQKHISYLESRLMQALEEKHKIELAAFDLLHCTLHPADGLQERIWNPLPWLNSYGFNFVENLINQDYSFEQEHYAVYV